MKLAKIEIRNLLGIKELEITPGNINVIEGKNERNKTSFLEAIKAGIQGGNDATLIHNDSEEAELVLVFDDSTALRRRIRGDKPALTDFTDEKGRKLAAPQQTLNQLFDAIAVNPIEFMNKKGRERTEALLEALPIDVSKADIEKNLNGSLDLIEVNETLSGLELIDNTYERIFTERTVINRHLKQKRAHAVELSETLDKDIPDPEKLEAEKEKTDAELKEVQKLERTEQTELHEKREAKKNELRTGHEKEIEELRRKHEKELEDLKAKHREVVNEINTTYSQDVVKINNKYNDQTKDLSLKLHDIDNKLRVSQKQANTKERLEEAQEEITTYQNQAENLTEDLEKLKNLKTEVSGKLPIEGLSIKDGEIYVNDIHYDRLNKAKQMEIAFEVAKLRNSEMKIVCVDGAEALDSENFEKFKNIARKSGLQLFITRVTDDENIKIGSEN